MINGMMIVDGHDDGNGDGNGDNIGMMGMTMVMVITLAWCT